MLMPRVAPLAALLLTLTIPTTTWAGDAESAALPRLVQTIQAVCPAVTDADLGAVGVAASVAVRPADQQGCAQPTINAFDWSAAAQTAWENLQARTAAKTQWASTDKLGKGLRCFAEILKDEFNVLRGQMIGVGTTTFDPPNLANATGATSSAITVTGAAFGDSVDVLAPYTLAGITATGYVSAANTVVVRLHNGTGGAVNLASGTWTVAVRRQGALAPRTLTQLRTAIDACIDGGAQD